MKKSAIENGFPFEKVSLIAEAESWRKEVYRPMYHVHKWWAQRLGSVFRSIIIASSVSDDEDVYDLFYKKNDLKGLVVFDPFMGSGTTIGEATKLGCTAIGRDINPVAYNGVRAAFSRVSFTEVQKTFKSLETNVGERIRSLYRLDDGSQVLYYFWVNQIPCPDCAKPVDLFKSYIFSRNAYPSKKPLSQCICPQCSEIFSVHYQSQKEICPSCSSCFNPQVAPAHRAKATCHQCNHEFSIVEAVKKTERPPHSRIYAKMVLLPDGTKEYRKFTAEDAAAYKKCELLLKKESALFEKTFIEAGHNTNQVLNYCYRSWDQFFNKRQLLALTWLGREIQKIDNPELRHVFTILFSGTLEFNNMFCSFKGEGTGAVRHMFSHHILKPERQPLEANVWGTPKSSGSFSTLYKSRLLRALEYRDNPFEVEVSQKGQKLVGVKKYGCNEAISRDIDLVKSISQVRPGSVYLSCGDSSKTDISDKTVDLVVTDPPFFDNVHYSELADFFYAWQGPMLERVQGGATTTRNSKEVQDADPVKFSDKLASVFQECHRVLKDEGKLVFTYHHSKEEGWWSVAKAISSAGFCFVSAQPVKSEMSVATPKHQAKEPIDLDIILVCKKRTDADRSFLHLDMALERAAEQARMQIQRFWETGRQLSRNDFRVIYVSQLIVALSPGRNTSELLTALDECSLHIKDNINLFNVNQEKEKVFASNGLRASVLSLKKQMALPLFQAEV